MAAIGWKGYLIENLKYGVVKMEKCYKINIS